MTPSFPSSVRPAKLPSLVRPGAFAFALSLLACHSSIMQQAPKSAPVSDYSGGYGGGGSQAAPSPAGAPSALSESRSQVPAERPGLGTTFGESRYSPVRDVPFSRDSDNPAFVANLHYNDVAGAEAQRRNLLSRYQPGEPLFRSLRPGRSSGLWGGVIVRVVDEGGQPLPAYRVEDRVLLVGEAGQRYSIEIENRTASRFEVVTSVDGLDVIDGRPAGLGKRGYLAAPYATLRIDGYRRTMTEIAAFRFGSVRDSYASQTAEFGDRHVGVIGVALFMERGAAWPTLDSIPPDLDEEARRREAADPFPSRFAPPPPPRPYY
jgi:hypothetical protein